MKKLVRLGILQFACGAVLAAVVMHWLMRPSRAPHGVTPVKQGVLYRSGQLEPPQLRDEIRGRGIRTVVSLGTPYDKEDAVCDELGVRRVYMPVGDVWQLCGLTGPHTERKPAEPIDLAPLWKLLESPDTRPVLIHCWGGVHRTGVVVAKYRIERDGWTPDDAIREMDLFGFQSSRAKFAPLLHYLRTYHQPQAAHAPQTVR